jgi:hypothetical protein
MRRLTHAAAVMSVGGAALSVAPPSAQAMLTSEGLGDHAPLRNSYNDDTGGNFGITFSSNTLASNTLASNTLATLDLGATPSTADLGTCADNTSSQFHSFLPIGVALSGAARSVDSGGAANQLAFDNIAAGSETPRGTAVPELNSIGLLCTGLVGLLPMLRRQRS